MSTWTWEDLGALVRAWDCPEDLTVELRMRPGGRTTIRLVNEAGCKITATIAADRPLDGLHLGLDKMVFMLRDQHGSCTYSLRLCRELGRAGKRFERRVDRLGRRRRWPLRLRRCLGALLCSLAALVALAQPSPVPVRVAAGMCLIVIVSRT